MDTFDIIIKLALIILFSGLIGFEREYNQRPAGFRTHMLVGISAAIISIIQVYIADKNLSLALANPEISNIFIYEQSRLIAQIISGIGFLGAGTIIVTKKHVVGLTTAASLWATASLGIAVGLGYFKLALISFIAIYLVLILLKRVTILQRISNIEIEFINFECNNYINEVLKKEKLMIRNEKNDFIYLDGSKIYKKRLVIKTNENTNFNNIIDILLENKNIIKVSLLDE